MPYTFNLEGNPPCGLAESIGVKGEEIKIRTSGFFTSMEGERFVSLAEGFESLISPALLHFKVLPSGIDHLVAIFHPDGRVEVFCNELLQRACCQLRDVSGQGVKKNQSLTVNNIGDIKSVQFFDKDMNPIIIPPNSGLIYIFSVSWRKGLFFDLSPLANEKKPRVDDIEKVMGKNFTLLTFYELYAANENEWTKLFEWGWFPFIGMSNGDRGSLILMAREGRYLESHIIEYCKNFAKDLRGRISNYEKKDFLSASIFFIKSAADHYEKEEWPAAISILYPRIEGIMRHVLKNEKVAARKLYPNIENLIGKREVHSSLFPIQFEKFLKTVVYKDFDLTTGNTDLGRHSYAHGAARFDDFNFINSTLLFLILDQMYFYLTE